jgi:Arc/MetJ family transcription regulator
MMTRRRVDIDDELLDDVMTWLGAKTIKDAVNQALRECADQRVRLARIQYWRTDPYRDLRELEALKKAQRRDIDTWSTRARLSEPTSSP